ncbi:hypothetical protein [Paludisphaera mucosa]|uniref:Uncharacterized protein n=1 Tax=Paludisphaera mucosa TaxID=3030827 RepID=A0ABT6FLD2_9BACT|nr:hypothetical protein [Paludisphaera mucosa]MDG3008170.1 hypothetical protein [Paludisphaera mucosa]
MDLEQDRPNVVGEVRPRAFFMPLLIGQVVAILLLGAAFSVGGFLGADLVILNRKPVHGVSALALGLGSSAALALVFSPLYAVFVCLGLWAFSLVRPLKVRVTPMERPPGEGDDLGARPSA